MIALGYLNSSYPSEKKQIFSVNHIITINYLDKLVQYGPRPLACKNTLI